MDETVEVVFRWLDGREEVRYRLLIGTEDARRLMAEVDKMRARLEAMNEECPYFYRFVK